MSTMTMERENSVSESMKSSAADMENQQSWKDEPKQRIMAKKDNTSVYASMVIVVGMIAITAAVVIGLTFSFLSKQDEDNFKHGFQQHAQVVAESSSFHAAQVVASLEAMSSSVTSFSLFARDNLNYTWPFITLPHFDRRGNRAREEAYLEMIAFSPLVAPADVEKWQNYSKVPMSSGPNGGLQLPFWQATPLSHDPSLLNFDLLLEPLYLKTLEAIKFSSRPAMSQTYYIDEVVRKYFDPVTHDQHHNHHAHHLGHDAASLVENWEDKYGDHKGHRRLQIDTENRGTEVHSMHSQQQQAQEPQGHQLTMDAREESPSLVEPPFSEGQREHQEMGMGTGSQGTMEMNTASNETQSLQHNPNLDTEEANQDVHGMAMQHQAHKGDHHESHTSSTPSSTNPHSSTMHADGMHSMDTTSQGDHHQDASSEHSAHTSQVSPQSDVLWAMTRPHSIVMAPVYGSFDNNSRVLVGVLHGILAWEFYLTDLLPRGIDGIIAILHNSCGQSSTFEIQGPHAEFIGDGDLHNPSYDDYVQHVDFGSFFGGDMAPELDSNQCFYSLAIYPSKELHQSYASDSKATFLSLLAIVFFVLALFFFVVVWFVQQRQRKVMNVATRTTSIVSSLFPDEVRDRIMQEAEAQAKKGAGTTDQQEQENLKNLLKTADALSSARTISISTYTSTSTTKTMNAVTVLEAAPIADHYPDTTVFFADLVGFTKWSSSRAPQDVFLLLETLYGEFDAIARRRRVFKVETIGDCYVATVGLPSKCRD